MKRRAVPAAAGPNPAPRDSSIDLLIAMPMPMPHCFVGKIATNVWSALLAGRPAPVS